MARQKTPEELSEALSFFPPGSVKSVQRLLKRAADNEARAARRGTQIGASSRADARAGKAIGAALAKQLTKAMRQRGAGRREQASVKQKAPDTGGRPFHFAHSIVNKADLAPSAKGGSGAKTGTKAAAHMKYIEREIAVEHTLDAGVDGPERKGMGGARLRQPEAYDREPSRERETPNVDGMTSSKAGQRYIENPVKLANGENVIFSFGTIGDAFEDRVAFWDKLEEAEKKNARVQSRLIVELPHEASPQARFEIVKKFTKRFEEMGLPYWAALHAPGKDNDSRNFHAHIVYSESPAKRMKHPIDGDEVWDFEVVDRYVSECRHVREKRPFRQKQHPFFRPKTAMRTLRKMFEEDSNAVLVREKVIDKQGKPVIYDARSYKNMGVDTVPMKSVDRIVADKMKSGRLTVLDRDFTKKMIRAELQEALARRDKDIMTLVRLEQTLEAVAKEPQRAKAHNSKLPKEMRVSPLAQMTSKAVRTEATRILDAKRAALSDDLMERSTRTSLQRIIEATDEKVIAASLKNTRDPVRRAELPSEEAARLLNDAALAELRFLEVESETRRKRTRYRIGLALIGWRDVVGAKVPETSPIMRETIGNAQDSVKPAQTKDREQQGKDGSGQKATAQPRGRPTIKMSATEFAQRIRTASEMTSAIFGKIAEMPRLEDRLRAIDALPGALSDARAAKEREGAQAATSSETQALGPTTVLQPAQATTRDERGRQSSSQTQVDPTVTAQSQVEETGPVTADVRAPTPEGREAPPADVLARGERVAPASPTSPALTAEKPATEKTAQTTAQQAGGSPPKAEPATAEAKPLTEEEKKRARERRKRERRAVLARHRARDERGR